MYKVVYGLKDIGSCGTFKEAFKVLYDAIKAEESISLQVLETATWIENTDQTVNLPICFYDARDIACENGWLVDGKWQEGEQKGDL